MTPKLSLVAGTNGDVSGLSSWEDAVEATGSAVFGSNLRSLTCDAQLGGWYRYSQSKLLLVHLMHLGLVSSQFSRLIL